MSEQTWELILDPALDGETNMGRGQRDAIPGRGFSIAVGPCCAFTPGFSRRSLLVGIRIWKGLWTSNSANLKGSASSHRPHGRPGGLTC